MNEVKYYELTEKLRKHDNPQACLFVWVKTGHITQKEFIVLSNYWANYIKEPLEVY